MCADIIQVALDRFTDFLKFEEIASAIMYWEGYKDIRPLGGVRDSGIDALESLHYAEGPRNAIVFQYTTQDYIGAKLKETVEKLQDKKINYSQLVIVTDRSLTTERQLELERVAREKYDLLLKVFDRKTVVNRLGDFNNGIFSRYFPDIEKQVALLRGSVNASRPEEVQRAMLSLSTSLVLRKETARVRKDIFDNLVLLTVLASRDSPLTIDGIRDELSRIMPNETFEREQIKSAITRLEKRSLLQPHEGGYIGTGNAKGMIEGSAAKVQHERDAILSGLVERISSIVGGVAEEPYRKLVRNAREVLVGIFRITGMDIARKFLPDSSFVSDYLQGAENLVKISTQGVNATLGKLLLTQIAEILTAPSDEEAEVLANWARSYLGAAVMNLDPALRELQASRFATKKFVLDTDFILSCVVKECPRSRTYTGLLNRLRSLGCDIIVPEQSISECVNHFSGSHRTYKHFGYRLTYLPLATVEERVWNMAVKGYYYAVRSGAISESTTYEQYLRNYYEPTNPEEFLREIVRETLPEGTKFEPLVASSKSEVPQEDVDRYTRALLELIAQTSKASYRTESENIALAEMDARLYLMTKRKGRAKTGRARILSGVWYLLTDSNRYLRAAHCLRDTDEVTCRPYSLISVLELIGTITVPDNQFVQLLDNPLLTQAVEEVWPDVEGLLNAGVDLRYKSLTRLRWDLGEALHNMVLNVEAAEDAAEAKRIEEIDSTIAPYLKLWGEANARGYKPVPVLQAVAGEFRRLEEGKADLERQFNDLTEKYKAIEEKITYFGKRKQRYLRRLMRQQGREPQ